MWVLTLNEQSLSFLKSDLKPNEFLFKLEGKLQKDRIIKFQNDIKEQYW